MKLPKILSVFVSVILISQTEAFLPSNAGINLASTDYTLTDLTVAGIVRVVARYFEDSNPDRYSPGDLTNLDPLTPSRLFQVHYGGCVYSTKFERAISAILGENLRISQEYSRKAVWHFNGNQINKASNTTFVWDLLKSQSKLDNHYKTTDGTLARAKTFWKEALNQNAFTDVWLQTNKERPNSKRRK